jgi:hypothetical protein
MSSIPHRPPEIAQRGLAVLVPGGPDEDTFNGGPHIDHQGIK